MRTPSRHRRGRVLVLAATTLGVLVAAFAGVGGAGAVTTTTSTTIRTLGKTASTPAPSCPATSTTGCQAVGKVTGFQTAADGRKNPFVAPAKGRIVQWSIRLSLPSSTSPGAGKPSEMEFFNTFYGTPPQAGIAILREKKLKKGKKPPAAGPQYKMVRQSPIEDLAPYLSSSKSWTTFLLSASLPVSKGDIVALTSPTWVPAFAVNVSSSNTWRASRNAKKCNGATNIKASKPQTLGSLRSYGCVYTAARILYTAGFIAG